MGKINYGIELVFDPWIGSDFARSQLLVIGDSHYCGNKECKSVCGVRGAGRNKDCADFTEDVIQQYIQWRETGDSAKYDDWMSSTFLKFEHIMLGSESTGDKGAQLFNEIAFYNYVQTAGADDKSNGQYTSEDYTASSAMCAAVIAALRPRLVIVWGNRAWCAMSSECWTQIDDVTGYYTLPNDGYRVVCVKVSHPSRASQDEMRTRIDAAKRHMRLFPK